MVHSELLPFPHLLLLILLQWTALDAAEKYTGRFVGVFEAQEVVRSWDLGIHMWRHIEGVFHRRMLVMGKGGTWKLTGQCLWHAHPYTNYHNTFIFWTNAELPLVWGRMPFMGYRAAPLPTTNSICNRQLTVPSRFFF